MTIEELKRQAGRLIIAGFEGTSLPVDIGIAAEQESLGGVVLFKRNIENHKQVHALLSELHQRIPKGHTPIIAVDQEGGRVVRLRDPLTVLPPARRLGEINDPELTRTAGRLVGRELAALGFNMNLAPILDVDTNPDSPIIGDRSYGGDVKTVVRHGFAFARGLRESGVTPCAKHFPGHGDANVDSHIGLPVLEHSRERLEQVELEPFAAWCRTAFGPIMTAHIVFKALDPDNPATASRAVLTRELRERLHFSGVILTDDLEMGAINDVGGSVAAAVKSIMAGADGLLICSNLELRREVISSLASKAASQPALAGRMAAAESRLCGLRKPIGYGVDINWVGSKEHEQLKTELSLKLN